MQVDNNIHDNMCNKLTRVQNIHLLGHEKHVKSYKPYAIVVDIFVIDQCLVIPLSNNVTNKLEQHATIHNKQ